MKIGEILTPQFAKSFSALLDGGIKDIDTKIALRLKRIEKKLREEQRNFQELQEAIGKEYADKDDKGEPIIIKNIYKINEANQIIANKKTNEIMDTDFDIGEKIAYESVKKVNLSVKDLIVLDGIIKDPIE